LLEKGIDDLKNRKKSASQFNSKPHPSPKNYFLILISIFFIVVPIGLEPQLHTNYVFGESDFRSQNVDDEHHDKGEAPDSASSSSSESRTRQDLIDPFDSGDNSNSKKLNENFVIPDIFGTQDHHSSTNTHPGSTKSSDSQSELQSDHDDDQWIWLQHYGCQQLSRLQQRSRRHSDCGDRDLAHGHVLDQADRRG